MDIPFEISPEEARVVRKALVEFRDRSTDQEETAEASGMIDYLDGMIP